MTSNSIREVLYRLNMGSEVPTDLTREAYRDTLQKEFPGRDVVLGTLLSSYMIKGPSKEEVTAFIDESLDVDKYIGRTIQVPTEKKIVSAIGSGKKGLKTINISTPSLIVAAAAGATTYKPVSKATSSLTGSADFLEMAGVNLNRTAEEVALSVARVGFGASRIEDTIPGFDSIYGGKFHVPTVLSFGFPALISPINYDCLLYGLAHPNITLATEVLKHYGVNDALVLSSTTNNTHFVDEGIPFGENRIVGIKSGIIGREIRFRPKEELNLNQYSEKDIEQKETIEENVRCVLEILDNQGSEAHIDTICMNAGNILFLAGSVEDYVEGFEKAQKTIKKGAALEKLVDIIEDSGNNSSRMKNLLEVRKR